MTILSTAAYGIAYCDADTALVDLATVSGRVAATVEAALIRGGIAPPNAADLAAVVARVSNLETSRNADEATLAALAAYVTARNTGNQSVGSSAAVPTVVTFASATSSAAGGWSAANPSRLVAVAAGEYDLHVQASFSANGAGVRGIAYRISGGAWQFFATRPSSGGTWGADSVATFPGITLTAGQYVEVGVWQDSGATLTVGTQRAALRRVA